MILVETPSNTALQKMASSIDAQNCRIINYAS